MELDVKRHIVLLVGLMATACAQAQTADWAHELLLKTEHGMGGVAIGNVDTNSPGNEVVALTSAGEVWVVRRVDDMWKAARVYDGDGELIMCAVADVNPDAPGDEIVAVGMVSGEESSSGPGQVIVLRRDGETWKASQAFQDDHMIHGVAIGDVSARREGLEIVAAGFNHRVTMLSRSAEGWRPETIHVANGRLKIALVADALPDRPGAEVLVCGSDGTVTLLYEAELGWRRETVLAGPVGRSRIAYGAPGVLIGGDDGTVLLARRDGGAWTSEPLTRDAEKIRGTAIGDVDAGVGGVELYTAGYSRNVTQIFRDEAGAWTSRVIYTDARPLHHLVAGEVWAEHPGLELVTCGHGGELILLYPITSAAASPSE